MDGISRQFMMGVFESKVCDDVRSDPLASETVRWLEIQAVRDGT